MALRCLVEAVFCVCRNIGNQIVVVILNIVYERVDMLISAFRWCL